MQETTESQNVLNYLETCVNAGFINEAVSCVVERAHAKILPKDPRVTNLSIYIVMICKLTLNTVNFVL